MKKLAFLFVTVMFLAAFATAQVVLNNGAPNGTGTQGISTNQTQAGAYNGSTASGGSTTMNGGGAYGTQGNSATLATTTGATTPAYTGNVIGVINYIPNYDVMGAHENGGRGCAACHAPHNQARGNGGTGSSYGAFADAQGGLWGEDTSAILSTYSGGITFNGGNSAHSGQLTWGVTGGGLTAATAWTDETYTGVATCLSCHDGQVSTGAMMTGVSYEQYFGLLNGVGIGMNSNRGTTGNEGVVQLYGNNPIPTFLGVTANTPNGYASTHPVGQTANASAVLKTVLTNANYGLAPAISGNTLTVANIPANTPYGNFAASYYPGALVAMVAKDSTFGDNFVVCTTCHNQHNMAVYGGGQRNETVPAGVTQVRTIFFVNGGYNPGAPYDPTHEPSTMRFCQQCHFSFSSEYFGASNIGTAY